MVNLSVRYPAIKASLLGRIGRLLAWSGRENDAIITFGYQLSLTMPLYHAGCDGRKLQININMGRFVCKVCEDVDLCASCYSNCRKHELPECRPICFNHAFLDISNIRTEVPTQSFESWLLDVCGKAYVQRSDALPGKLRARY